MEDMPTKTLFACILFEPRCEKTGFLHMRKQRRRLAARETLDGILDIKFERASLQSVKHLIEV